MKRFFLLVAISLTCMSFLATTAEAKRFGGGSSVGKQRTVSPTPTQPSAAPGAKPGTPAPAPAPAGNRWLGPLAGLAAGLGLAALFSSLGMSPDIGMLLMLLVGAFLIFALFAFMRRKAAHAEGAPHHQFATAGPAFDQRRTKDDTVIMSGPVTASTIPADFPVESFLRSAKTSFIRLQTANDRKDLDDIREYTTPEMFAEISMQIRERDNSPQQTEVLAINTELLEVVNEGNLAIASVRMSGQIRENHGPAENFDEIWHVQKDLRDPKAVWLLSGIQQLS